MVVSVAVKAGPSPRVTRPRGWLLAPAPAPLSALQRQGIAVRSRWCAVPFLCRCRNSIGSSIVRMWSARSRWWGWWLPLASMTSPRRHARRDNAHHARVRSLLASR